MHQFAIGEIVWAKVIGYPPWPAKVLRKQDSNKVEVFFYGTKETGMVLFHHIYKLAKHWSRFSAAKTCKPMQFQEALAQINKITKGFDTAPPETPIAKFPTKTGSYVRFLTEGYVIHKNCEYITMVAG